MKYYLHIFLIFALSFFVFGSDKIIRINDSNYRSILQKKNSNIFILFHADDKSSVSNNADDMMKKAFENLKENMIYAKVNILENPKIVSEYKVNGFPLFKLIQNKKVLDYDLQMNENDLMNWLKKKTSPLYELIDTQDRLEYFINNKKTSLVYFGKSKKLIKILKRLSGLLLDVDFAVVENEELFSKVNQKEGILLFKDNGKKQLRYNKKQTSFEEIKKFVQSSILSSVKIFDNKIANDVFGGNESALFLFRDLKDPKTKEYDEIMEAVALKLKGKISVILADFHDELGSTFANFLSIYEVQLPAIRLVGNSEEGTNKFKFNGNINNVNEITNFYAKWRKNKLEPYFKSEPIPLYSTKPLKKIVTDNFMEFLSSNENIFVVFCVENYDECDNLYKLIEKIADNTRLKDESVSFGWINMIKNELPMIQDLIKYPTIRFFKKKSKAYMQYDENGFSNVKVAKFIETSLKNKFKLDL